ncbi:MAG: phosphoketolase family protein [Bacilli bacterium]|nr:phosphoketolase family protein [Bacilli bacterium]
MTKITKEEIELLDKYFRAANYLSACQLYLLENPLLEEKLEKKHIKKKIVGHWGTVPAQNFIYTHLNRLIKKHNLDIIYISGPGHGGNFLTSNTYLEGSYTEFYPNIKEDKEGLKKLFKQFSFPGGISSHAAPENPGTIHEGGELGYSLSHAFGAVLDNPNLIAACVVGDGEAETGPLATSWNGVKFINPKTDGTVLPILNLNGYKISNPTIFGRMTNKELGSFFYALGYKPYLVEGKEPKIMHELMAKTMDKVLEDIVKIKKKAKRGEEIPRFPMIILKTPKGWTGPKEVNGSKIEGTFKAHQVPINMEEENHLELLEKWLKSYHPEELFDENGKLNKEIKKIIPTGNKRIGKNAFANGGLLLKDLILPNFKNYEINIKNHGEIKTSDMLELSGYIRDIFKYNPKNFRAFSPDEAMSNRLYKMFEATNRDWQDKIKSADEYLSKDGRIMDSYLSEHFCEGVLEGYLLTGRHGFFSSYEAFIRIVDSMASQHAKWLKVCHEIPWRRSIASLNFLLTSNVWQQDHNGYTHQDPGFLDHMANKKADTVRMYLPPDANCLISTFDHCIKSRDYVNVIIASKHPSYQWLTMNEAIEHCIKGISIWPWVSNDEEKNPDIVIASCGDTPTLEAIAAIDILHKELPNLKIRYINVIDLMKLQSNEKHPHGLTNEEYNALFTKDKPIIFNYHGYPTLIHELTYLRKNRNISVHGYEEEGTITTAFDMRVQNKIDRFNLVIDVINHLKNKTSKETYLLEKMKNKLIEHTNYISEYGEDLEEIKNWKWNSSEN